MALYDSLFGMMDLQAAQASLVLLMLVGAPCFALAAVVAKHGEHPFSGAGCVRLFTAVPYVSVLRCAWVSMSLVTEASPPQTYLLQMVAIISGCSLCVVSAVRACCRCW